MARAEGDLATEQVRARVQEVARVPARLGLGVGIGIGIGLGLGLGRRSSVSWRPLEGWWVASKGLGPLRSRKASALGRGCDMGGRVALRLARAAAVSTG